MIALNRIEIWEPNWGRKTAIVDPDKVKEHNIIYFTRAKAYEGLEYYITGNMIKSCTKIVMKTKQGKDKQMYDVPLAMMEQVAKPEGSV